MLNGICCYVLDMFSWCIYELAAVEFAGVFCNVSYDMSWFHYMLQGLHLINYIVCLLNGKALLGWLAGSWQVRVVWTDASMLVLMHVRLCCRPGVCCKSWSWHLTWCGCCKVL